MKIEKSKTKKESASTHVVKLEALQKQHEHTKAQLTKLEGEADAKAKHANAIKRELNESKVCV